MGKANAPALPSLPQRREAFGALMGLAEIGTRVAHAEDRVVPGPAGALGIRVYTPTGATAELSLIHISGTRGRAENS